MSIKKFHLKKKLIHKGKTCNTFYKTLKISAEGRLQKFVHNIYGIVTRSLSDSFSLNQCYWFNCRVVRGVGEIDIDKPQPAPPKPDLLDDGCPYLLLDIRIKDDYDQFHMISGKGT